MIAVEMPYNYFSCFLQDPTTDLFYFISNSKTGQAHVASFCEILSGSNIVICGQNDAKHCFLEWSIFGPFVSRCESLQQILSLGRLVY